MKKFLLLGIVLYSCVTYAQIGIGTDNPQQDLHISGSGRPLMRVDGLNSSNNDVHENSNSTKRVFTTYEGDFVLAKNKEFFSSPVTLKNLTSGGETLINSVSFTLEHTSLVHFESYLSLTLSVEDNNTVQDSQARRFGVYYKFTNSPSSISRTTTFGNHLTSYTTASSGSSTVNYKIGNFYFVPRKEMILPPGNYTVALYGYLGTSMIGTANSSSQVTQNIRVRTTPISFNY